jgi:hypothetical protein
MGVIDQHGGSIMREGSKRRRLRFTLAGMMGLVLLMALGLNEYRRREGIRRSMIGRAAVILEAYVPGAELDDMDARVAMLSADGRYQQVVFTDRKTKATQ